MCVASAATPAAGAAVRVRARVRASVRARVRARVRCENNGVSARYVKIWWDKKWAGTPTLHLLVWPTMPISNIGEAPSGHRTLLQRRCDVALRRLNVAATLLEGTQCKVYGRRRTSPTSPRRFSDVMVNVA